MGERIIRRRRLSFPFRDSDSWSTFSTRQRSSELCSRRKQYMAM